MRNYRTVSSLIVLVALAGCRQDSPSDRAPQGHLDGASSAVIDDPPPAPVGRPEPQSSDGASVQVQTGASSRPAESGARAFASVREIFDVVPENMRPDGVADWTDLKVAAANRVLAKQVVGHPAQITAKVRSADVASGRFNKNVRGLPRIRADQPAMGSIPVTLWAYFPANSIEQAATINPGDTVLISGIASRADLTREGNGNGVRLNIDLSDSRCTKVATTHGARNTIADPAPNK